MLNSLTIENYALIGRLEIGFNPGLNILTGETGAGKSIIIGALSMVLGERASGEVVRAGEKKAYVEAAFDISKNKKLQSALPSFGIEADSSLILSREILSAGRTQARVNGRTVTQSLLRSISRNLIDIHGQHEHQSLLDQSSHVDILDNMGGKELLKLREAVARDHSALQALRAELMKLEGSAAEREKQMDYLKYQIKEIDDLGLEAGEDEKLKSERDLLANSEKLAAGASEIHNLISEGEDGGALDRIRSSSERLKDLASVDKSLSKLSKSLETAYYSLDDISSEMASYQDKVEFDPARLEVVEERLESIRELKRKYGESIDDILRKRDEMAGELQGLEGSDERIGEVRAALEKAGGDLAEKCQGLSKIRKDLAGDVEAKVKKELSELNMPKVRFKVDVKSEEDENGIKVKGKTLKVWANGIDRVEFMISPNPGQPLKSLSRIASGGEISRTMLALKSIMGSSDAIPTMIFDEIDTGIGGRTAVAVGEKMSGISRNRQVICVTHLPQIASRPGRHLHVDKSVDSGKTHVSVRELKGGEREREIANLIGGKASDSTLKTAKELISS